MTPLARLQRRLLEDYKQAVAKHEKDVEEWREKKRAADKGDGDDPGEKPEPPVYRRVFVSDITIEKLAEVLEDNPRGVLVARDELSGWLGSFSRYKARGAGSDLPNWLEMSRAGTVQVDRKTGDRRTIFVPRAAVSVTGGIQPGTLTRALTPEFLDAGLAARLLLAMPTRKQKQWSEAELSPDTEDAFVIIFEKLRALEMRKEDKDRLPIPVRLSPEAKEMWVRHYNAFAAVQAGAEGEVAAVLSKLEGYAARLALLHHAVRSVFLGTDCTQPVTTGSMEAGIVLAEWFAGEARRIYSILSETEEERDARRLVEFNTARGGSMSGRELQRANSRKYPSADHAENALDVLVSAGLGRWEDSSAHPAGGRPPMRRLVLCPTPDKTDRTSEAEGEAAAEAPDETSDGTL
jgi:hypothetical protein